MITLEQRKFNLITAVQLAEFERNRNKTDRMSGNAIVLIHTCALEYHAAGGVKYNVNHDTVGDPFLIMESPGADF